MMGGYQEFGGLRYRFNPSNKRYQRGKNGRQQLHRDVYRDTYGNIPHGWSVHHKDGDVHNNVIDNLEAMPEREHMRMHRLALSIAAALGALGNHRKRDYCNRMKGV
jgi:hypothetical protein